MTGTIDGIIDPKLGLLTRFNCKFMMKEIDMVNKSLCDDFTPVIAHMSIVILVVSIFLIIG
jgi:hypothetical protein